MATRDLNMARLAFKNKDVELVKRAHSNPSKTIFPLFFYYRKNKIIIIKILKNIINIYNILILFYSIILLKNFNNKYYYLISLWRA